MKGLKKIGLTCTLSQEALSIKQAKRKCGIQTNDLRERKSTEVLRTVGKSLQRRQWSSQPGEIQKGLQKDRVNRIPKVFEYTERKFLQLW